MSYSANFRDFESPLAAVGAFFKNIIPKWLRYKKYVCFDFEDKNPKKPCLILGCGNKEIVLNTQTVLLLREALKKDPTLLDDYLDGWLIANAEDYVAMTSSGTKKPKRRLGSKPNSTYVANKVVKVTSDGQQVIRNVSDAVDSALG
jgi:hypothetical protein